MHSEQKKQELCEFLSETRLHFEIVVLKVFWTKQAPRSRWSILKICEKVSLRYNCLYYYAKGLVV